MLFELSVKPSSGLISAICTSTGFDIIVNGNCLSSSFSFLPTIANWHVGDSTSSECLLTAQGDLYRIQGKCR